MRPGHLLALAMLAITSPAAALHAQGGASGDPLTGTWVGHLANSGGSRSDARFELARQPDGTFSGVVTGPQLIPGDITDGTFDAATGAVKFVVVIRGSSGDGGRVSFDGRIARDTASGSLVLNGENGTFTLVRTSTSTSAAPPAPRGDPGAAVRAGFAQVSEWLIRSAELVPAERYAYRPVETVRTFGQLVAHVVDGTNYYCGRAAGRDVPWSDATEKNVSTKAALIEALRKSLAECRPVYDGTGDIAPLMENLVHSGLHYGNMITYMRMLGLTPPSS